MSIKEQRWKGIGLGNYFFIPTFSQIVEMCPYAGHRDNLCQVSQELSRDMLMIELKRNRDNNTQIYLYRLGLSHRNILGIFILLRMLPMVFR